MCLFTSEGIVCVRGKYLYLSTVEHRGILIESSLTYKSISVSLKHILNL